MQWVGAEVLFNHNLFTVYDHVLFNLETVHILFEPNKNSVHAFLKGKDASRGT